MAYNDKPILLDKDKRPIPQYFNRLTNQYEPIEGLFGANSFLQKGTVAEEAWEGSESILKTFPSVRYGFSIVNDGTADLSFTINEQNRRVKPGEAYSSLFQPFNSVYIEASSFYRAEVLS